MRKTSKDIPYITLGDGRKVKFFGCRLEDKIYEPLIAQSDAEKRSASAQAIYYISKGLEADGYDVG